MTHALLAADHTCHRARGIQLREHWVDAGSSVDTSKPAIDRHFKTGHHAA